MLRRVAVTGLGICTPIGLTVETFWHNLLNGLSGLTAAPGESENQHMYFNP